MRASLRADRPAASLFSPSLRSLRRRREPGRPPFSSPAPRPSAPSCWRVPPRPPSSACVPTSRPATDPQSCRAGSLRALVPERRWPRDAPSASCAPPYRRGGMRRHSAENSVIYRRSVGARNFQAAGTHEAPRPRAVLDTRISVVTLIMRIEFDEAKRSETFKARGLDSMRKANERERRLYGPRF